MPPLQSSNRGGLWYSLTVSNENTRSWISSLTTATEASLSHIVAPPSLSTRLSAKVSFGDDDLR